MLIFENATETFPFWIGFFNDELHGCLEDAHRLRYPIVIGGDFNSQLGIGTQGVLLQDLADYFNLCINDDGEHVDNDDDPLTMMMNMLAMMVTVGPLKAAWVFADELILSFAIVVFIRCLATRFHSWTWVRIIGQLPLVSTSTCTNKQNKIVTKQNAGNNFCIYFGLVT